MPRVGDNKALDLERIVALKPDLIVVWRHGNAQRQIDRLRDLHVPLFFSEPHRLDDIPVTIDKLGTLLGTSHGSRCSRTRYRHDIARIAHAVCEPTARQRVLSGVGRSADDAQRRAHGQRSDRAVRRPQRVRRTSKPLVPTVSTEAVLAANPEAIVTADARRDAAGPPAAVARHMERSGRR